MNRSPLIYAFGHLVGSHNAEDPHAADSGDLADDVLTELDMPPEQKAIVEALAEHVAGNYTYHGEAERFAVAAERGEV